MKVNILSWSIAFVLCIAISQAAWSQSIDSVLISSKEYRAAKKNINDYKKLIAEHKHLDQMYKELKSSYDRLNNDYTSLHRAKKGDDCGNLKRAYNDLLADDEKNGQTIRELKDAYLFCRSQVIISTKRQRRRFEHKDQIWSNAMVR